MSERWARHTSFAAKWYERPLADGDGADPTDVAAAEAELGARLPEAVREAYALLGGREEARGCLPAPEDLAWDEEHADYLIVNRGEDEAPRALRRVDLGQADPPVFQFVEFDSESYEQIAETFSSFLLAQLLFETAMRGDGFTDGVPDVGRYTRLPLPTWPHFSWDETVTLYGDADTVIAVQGREHANAATRTPEAQTALEASDPSWTA